MLSLACTYSIRLPLNALPSRKLLRHVYFFSCLRNARVSVLGRLAFYQRSTGMLRCRPSQVSSEWLLPAVKVARVYRR